MFTLDQLRAFKRILSTRKGQSHLIDSVVNIYSVRWAGTSSELYRAFGEIMGWKVISVNKDSNLKGIMEVVIHAGPINADDIVNKCRCKKILVSDVTLVESLPVPLK